jgi:hypothetical protein
MYTIPSNCTLDWATEISSKLEGVALETLGAFDTIYVRTMYSDYQIFLLDPETGRALIQGGKYLAEPAEGMVCGSTFGGCMLKLRWLGVGLRMELNVNGQRLVTSAIQSLRVVSVGVDHEEMSWDQPETLNQEI